MGKSANYKAAISAQRQAKQAKGMDAVRADARAGAMYRRLTVTEKAKYHLDSVDRRHSKRR